jgi:hypothetical protein
MLSAKAALFTLTASRSTRTADEAASSFEGRFFTAHPIALVFADPGLADRWVVGGITRDATRTFFQGPVRRFEWRRTEAWVSAGRL